MALTFDRVGMWLASGRELLAAAPAWTRSSSLRPCSGFARTRGRSSASSRIISGRSSRWWWRSWGLGGCCLTAGNQLGALVGPETAGIGIVFFTLNGWSAAAVNKLCGYLLIGYWADDRRRGTAVLASAARHKAVANERRPAVGPANEAFIVLVLHSRTRSLCHRAMGARAAIWHAMFGGGDQAR